MHLLTSRAHQPPVFAESIRIELKSTTVIAQLLLAPAGAHGGTDSYLLGRRALKFQGETAFTGFCASLMLPKDSLHSRIADKVWAAFRRGDYDVAVFQAMKAVEVYVRDAAKLSEGLLETKQARTAFDPTNGPHTDLAAEADERNARSALLARAIGFYKNPLTEACR
jgi:uncharacterized protein (TIGR02391 family)